MIINPEFRKCVTYLFVDKLDKSGETIRSPLATAFYVGFQISSGWVMYLVTARHVIRKSRPFGPLIVRNNLSDGTFQDSSTSQNDWIGTPRN